MLWVIVLGLLTGSGVCEMLIGYDCTNPKMNISTLSLNSVKECDFKGNDTRVDKHYVQVLQSKQFNKVKVQSCRVLRSYIMHYCGKGHSNYMVREGLGVQEVMHVQRTDCAQAIEVGLLKPNHESDFMITGIKLNTTFVHKGSEVGDVDRFGYCNTGDRPTTITINGVTYNNVLMVSTYEVLVREFWQDLNIETGKLIFRSGQEFEASAGRGFDVDLGDVFWTVNPEQSIYDCNARTHASLYEGPAYLITGNTGNPMLIVNATSRSFAIQLREEGVFCGYEGYDTEHPRIKVLISVQQRPFRRDYTSINEEDIDPTLYGNAKLVYLGHHVQTQVETLYAYVRQEDCDIRYQMLTQLTSMAYSSAEEFAWAYLKTPGVTAVLAGEVMYIMHCEPVAVTFRRSTKCYHEIPVSHKNKTLFMKPRNRILVEFGTELPCNPLTPPLFSFNGAWYQLQPTPHQVPSPQLLDSSSKRNWTYQQVSDLFQSGLYTREDMERYQKRLLFPLEKPAIQQVIGYHAIGYDADRQFVNLNGLLDEDKIHEYQESLFKKIYGWIWDISLNCAGFFGFITLIGLIRYCINLIINGTLLYKLYGVSFKLLTVMLGSSALNALNLFTKNKYHQTDAENPDELVQAESKTRAQTPVLTYAELSRQLHDV